MCLGERPVFCNFPLAVVVVVVAINHCHHLVVIFFLSFTILNVDLVSKKKLQWLKKNSHIMLPKAVN